MGPCPTLGKRDAYQERRHELFKSLVVAAIKSRLNNGSLNSSDWLPYLGTYNVGCTLPNLGFPSISSLPNLGNRPCRYLAIRPNSEEIVGPTKVTLYWLDHAFGTTIVLYIMDDNHTIP